MIENKLSDLINQGFEAFQQGKWSDLIKIAEALLADNKEPAIAYYLLAHAHKATNCYAIARHFFQKALEIKPNNINFLYNLAACEHDLNNRETSIKIYKEILDLMNDSPSPDITRGMVFSNLAANYIGYGTKAEGLKYSKLALDASNEKYWFERNNYAQALLENGRFEDAWKYYDARLESEKAIKEAKIYSRKKDIPMWNGEENCTLIIHGEQGLGDEVMFLTIFLKALEDLRKKNIRIILDTNNRLVNIIRESFPDLEIFGTKNYQDQSKRTWIDYIDADYKLPIGSLCKFYAGRLDKNAYFQFLKIPQRFINHSQNYLPVGKKLIGFSWYGGVEATNIYHRYIKLDYWRELFQGIDANFISLQYNETAEKEIEDFKKKTGLTNIYHYSNLMKDFDLTCGLIANMDYVISAPQTCVHIGGALGIPTIQLNPDKAMWQMLHIDKFYKSVRVFEQLGDWARTMKDVKDYVNKQ